MKAKELMSRNVMSVAADEALSKALSRMKSGRVHQLVVTEGGKLAGMLELKAVISKDIDLASAKAGGLARSVPYASPEDDESALAEKLLGSGMRALPVVSGGEVVGIISETDIMKTAAKFIGKGVKLCNIMTPCVYVSKGEKAAKVRSLMLDTNVSRVPVMEGDDVAGVVGTLDLIKVMEARAGQESRGGRTTERGATEKSSAWNISAESVMSRAAVLPGDATIADVIPLLRKNEEVVVKNGEIGIIIPKDVMELLVKSKKEGTYVQITGMQDEDIAFKAKMDSAVQEFVQKYTRMTDNIEYLYAHVEKHHKQGKKQKYSIRLRFKVPFGFFVSHSWGWRPIDVIQDAFKNLEREIMKKYGKLQEHEKEKKSKTKRMM